MFEKVFKGLDKIHEALNFCFNGNNIGKVLIQVSDDSN